MLGLGLIYPFGPFHYQLGRIFIQIPFRPKILFLVSTPINIIIYKVEASQLRLVSYSIDVKNQSIPYVLCLLIEMLIYRNLDSN